MPKSKKIPPPLTQTELQDKISCAAMRIEMAEQDEVATYLKYVDKLIEHIGLDPMECFVSDKSMVGDFHPDLKELSKKVGFEVKDEDYIWEVARRMGAN